MLRSKVVDLKDAGRTLAASPAHVRDQLISAFADSIERNADEILSANSSDLEKARGTIPPALFERLALSKSKIADLTAGIRRLAELPDPVGAVQSRTELDSGLVLDRVSIPLGVVAVIFESRPDVLPQVLSLALRTGNGIILKGGQEAEATNRALIEAFFAAAGTCSFPPACALLVEGREAVRELLEFDDLIDLVIPRGSNELVRRIMEQSRIPVLGHASGVCHLYIHSNADLGKAIALAVDGKTQYPAACNSIETILIDTAIEATVLTPLLAALRERKVRILGCERTAKNASLPASDRVTDWSTEYGELTVAVKIVDSLDEAITHINTFGSHHTDAIATENSAASEEFLRRVDSASVFSNCSTRFADGFRFGFGAEVGIGTGKLHARGPVGVEGLLTYKYQLRGSGQVVRDYTGESAKRYSHKKVPL